MGWNGQEYYGVGQFGGDSYFLSLPLFLIIIIIMVTGVLADTYHVLAFVSESWPWESTPGIYKGLELEASKEERHETLKAQRNLASGGVGTFSTWNCFFWFILFFFFGLSLSSRRLYLAAPYTMVRKKWPRRAGPPHTDEKREICNDHGIKWMVYNSGQNARDYPIPHSLVGLLCIS